jgi:hypothetical protein
MVRTHVVIAFLSGVVLALSAALVMTANRGGLPEAYGQVSGNNEIIAMMGTMNTGKGPTDNFYIIDSKSMRVAIYQWNGQTLNVGAIRNMTYDMKPEQYPDSNQKPSVSDMRDATRAEYHTKKK